MSKRDVVPATLDEREKISLIIAYGAGIPNMHSSIGSIN